MGALNSLKSALVPPELHAAKCSKAGGLKHCQAKLRKFRLFCVLQNGTKGCDVIDLNT